MTFFLSVEEFGYWAIIMSLIFMPLKAFPLKPFYSKSPYNVIPLGAEKQQSALHRQYWTINKC